MRRNHHYFLVVVAVSLIPSLMGCGTGILGEDDVQPGACSVGSAAPVVLAAPVPEEVSSHLKIYLLRGLDNFYSFGLDRLADEMRQMNLKPTLVDWPSWEFMANDMTRTYSGATERAMFVLIGHSYGADDAIRMARYLRDHQITVRLLFLLDATSPDSVPDNVDVCIHYYEPSVFGDLFPSVFAGNPVVADVNNFHSQIMNQVFSQAALGSGIGCANHFSIDANQLMHNIIIREVLKLVDIDPTMP